MIGRGMEFWQTLERRIPIRLVSRDCADSEIGAPSGRHGPIEAAGKIRRRTVEENIVRRAGGEVGQIRPRDGIRSEIGSSLHPIVLADGQRDFRDEAGARHRDGRDKRRSSRGNRAICRHHVGAEFAGVAGGFVRGCGGEKKPR